MTKPLFCIIAFIMSEPRLVNVDNPFVFLLAWAVACDPPQADVARFSFVRYCETCLWVGANLCVCPLCVPKWVIWVDT